MERKEHFLGEVIENKLIAEWVENKLVEICQRHGLTFPAEQAWGLCVGEPETNRHSGTLLCQKEFNVSQAVGFQIDHYRGEILAASVFLDLHDKFVFFRKERYKRKSGYKKEYYNEIIFPKDVAES